MDSHALWDAYRNDPRYRDLLLEAGVGGPSDMGRTLSSSYVVVPAEDDEPAILLSEYVIHTIAAYKGTSAC